MIIPKIPPAFELSFKNTLNIMDKATTIMHINKSFEVNKIKNDATGDIGGISVCSVKYSMKLLTVLPDEGTTEPNNVSIIVNIIRTTNPKYFLSSTFERTIYKNNNKGVTTAIV